MYDTAVLDAVECGECGAVHAEPKPQLQFKIHVGTVYRPDLQVVRVGDRLPRMPPLPEFMTLGWANCPACGKLYEVWLIFKRGVLWGWEPWDKDAPAPLTAFLPQPKSARTRARRKAISDYEHARRVHAAYGKTPNEMTVGEAITLPMWTCLNMESLASQIFTIRPIATERIGPFGKVAGKWQRIDPMYVETRP